MLGWCFWSTLICIIDSFRVTLQKSKIQRHACVRFDSGPRIYERLRIIPQWTSRRHSSSRIWYKDGLASINPKNGLQMSVLDGGNIWHMLSATAVAAYGGTQLEQRTRIGKSLSAPVCAMLIGAIATNMNILPPTGSIHITALQSFSVKLALPLLLINADLRQIVLETGVLFKAFLLGTISTLIGSLIGFFLFLPDIKTIGVDGDGWKLIAALTSKNIGGGINFIAVANHFKATAPSIALALAVDNILGIIYFPLVSYLGDIHPTQETPFPTSLTPVSYETSSASANGIIAALAISTSIVTVSEAISRVTIIPSAVISTCLSVIFGTFFPKRLSSAFSIESEMLGKALLMLFFGSIGNSAGTIASLSGSKGISVLIKYAFVLYGAHLAVILTMGKLFFIPLPDILIASNANIGNGATASALASAKGWKSRVLPALLVGTFGNAVGTIIGLVFGESVFRHFTM